MRQIYGFQTQSRGVFKPPEGVFLGPKRGFHAFMGTLNGYPGRAHKTSNLFLRPYFEAGKVHETRSIDDRSQKGPILIDQVHDPQVHSKEHLLLTFFR